MRLRTRMIASAWVAPWSIQRVGTSDERVMPTFRPRRIGQIDDVVAHAVAVAPVGFAAGALVEMAPLRMNDAGVALRQLAEARVTIALVETLVGLAATMDTKNAPGVFELHGLAEQSIKRHKTFFASISFFGQHRVVRDRIFQPRFHFPQSPAGNPAQRIVSKFKHFSVHSRQTERCCASALRWR